MIKKGSDSTRKINEYHKLFLKVKNECKKTIVGQDRVIEGLLRGIICDGHILVEGVPGIAKTLIVRTLSKITGGTYSRVQFTADLLPTDITGLTTYERNKGFSVVKGPIFANFVIADEINRSPPKVQSALLQAMQEKEVTIGPSDAFGEINPKLKKEVLKSAVPLDQEPKVGMKFLLGTGDGQKIPVRIGEVKKETITLDMNPPLAGRKLLFKIKIIE